MAIDRMYNNAGNVRLFFASELNYGNFGDLLSRYMVEKLSGLKVEKYDHKKTAVHLSAIGELTEDDRFYELPLDEYRKSIEEIKSHKRNQYRKRFAALDSLESSIKSAVQCIIKK